MIVVLVNILAQISYMAPELCPLALKIINWLNMIVSVVIHWFEEKFLLNYLGGGGQF